MSNSAGRGREFLHLRLPIPTKELLRRLRYEKRVSITDIIVRLLDRAEKEAVLEDWIQQPAGSDQAPNPSREEASAA